VTIPDLAYQGIYPGPNRPAMVLDYSTVFTLNVTDTVDDVPYVAQNQLTVTVVAEPLPPLITSFTGSIDSSATPWQIELAWTAENAKYCILSTEPSNNAPPNGTFEGPLVPPQSVYTLIAVNEQGQQSPPSTLSLGWALAGAWPGSSSNLIDLAFSSDGSRLYVANNNQVAVFAPTDNVNSPLTNTGLAISTDLIYTSVAVSKDGLLYVASASFDSNGNQTAAQIQVFDASALSQIGSGVSLASTANVINMAVWTGSEGSYLFAADTINSNMPVFTITGSSRDPLQAFGSPYGFATLMGVRTSPDGTQIYVLTGFTIDSYQPTGNATSQLQYVASYPLGDQVQRGFGVAPGRNYPAAQYDNQSQVTVFDTGSMAIGSPSASIGGQVGGIAIAPDGSRVYVGMFGSVNNGIIRARSCPAGSAAELRCRRPMQRSAPPASLRDAKLGRPRISKKVRN